MDSDKINQVPNSMKRLVNVLEHRENYSENEIETIYIVASSYAVYKNNERLLRRFGYFDRFEIKPLITRENIELLKGLDKNKTVVALYCNWFRVSTFNEICGLIYGNEEMFVNLDEYYEEEKRATNEITVKVNLDTENFYEEIDKIKNKLIKVAEALD